ncbi:MAG: hypothetical protein QXK74_07485 [Candidatus Nitrosocaldaceae archaeon]
MLVLICDYESEYITLSAIKHETTKKRRERKERGSRLIRVDYSFLVD